MNSYSDSHFKIDYGLDKNKLGSENQAITKAFVLATQDMKAAKLVSKADYHFNSSGNEVFGAPAR